MMMYLKSTHSFIIINYPFRVRLFPLILYCFIVLNALSLNQKKLFNNKSIEKAVYSFWKKLKA